MQTKYLFSILFMLFLFSSAQALMLQEKSLSTYTFPGFEINTPATTHCETITFNPFPTYTESTNDTLLNLNIEFTPATDFDSNVTVSSNNQLIQTIYSRNFEGKRSAHVLIPAAIQNENGTTLEICGNSSPALQRLYVSSTGTLGLYQQPHFDRANDFETFVVTPERILGQEVEVQVRVHNSGALPASVHVDYRKYDLPHLPLLKGETGFDATLEPNESRTITYYIKPLRAVDLALPPAVLTYTNIFGEEEKIESNRAQVRVKQPEFNVKGVFLLNQTHARVNEPIDVRWLAQNDGIDPLYGLSATYVISPENEVTLPRMMIPELLPSKAESRGFTIQFAKPGTYTLGCVIFQESNPELHTNCQGTTITITEDTRLITLLLSLLLVVIGIGVYAYIYYSKPQSKTEVKPKKRFQA